MNTARICHKNCIIDKKLYTFGGGYDATVLNSFEVLDFIKLYSNDKSQNEALWVEFTFKDYQARSMIYCVLMKNS